MSSRPPRENKNLKFYDDVLDHINSQIKQDRLHYVKEQVKSNHMYLTLLKQIQQMLLNILDITKIHISCYSINDMMGCLETLCYYQMVYLNQLHHSPMTYDILMKENRELFIRKNNDYGSSFEDFGFIGIIVRINDKINRIKSLMDKNGNPQVQNEALDDSVQDLYNYCVLGMMYKFKND
jgi:hypothetical protein